MGSDSSKPDNTGENAAHKIERIYLNEGEKKATEAFRADLDGAVKDPTKQAAFKAELTTLKAEPEGQQAVQRAALEWADPKAQKGPITTDALSAFTKDPGKTTDSQYDALMAEVIKSQYSSLTSGLAHDFSSMWNGRGIRTGAIEGQKQELDMMRSKGTMAEKANDLLLSNDGSLFKKLADKNGHLDKAGLEKALKDDQTPGATRLFTDTQRETVKSMLDNYKTAAISQLRDQSVRDYPMTINSIHQAVLENNVAKFPAMDADKTPLMMASAESTSLALVNIPDIKPVEPVVDDGKKKDAPTPTPVEPVVDDGKKKDAPTPAPVEPVVDDGKKKDAPTPTPVEPVVDDGKKKDAPTPMPVEPVVDDGKKKDAPTPMPVEPVVDDGKKKDAPTPAPVEPVVDDGKKKDAPTPAPVEPVVDDGKKKDAPTPAPVEPVEWTMVRRKTRRHPRLLSQ